MDIHRCRFVPYSPASISALAFSHTSDLSRKAPADLRLALGRDNSDIEIWNPRGGSWLQETVLRGTLNSTVEQLVWTQDLVLDESDSKTVAKPGPLRLFSIGGSKSITEWSLTAGKPIRHAESSYRDIWCFAAQPSYSIPEDGKIDGEIPAQYLAAGCADGTIVLFSTADTDLRYSQILHAPPVIKAKVLSIAWRDRNTVVAGYEDGFIRVLDVSSRTVLRQMTLGRTADGGRNFVWTVKCLADGTILTGDSDGELKIWDAQNFSLTQRLKSHEADVLDIVTSAKGDLIFTVGVDRRTIAYQPLPPLPGQKRKRWAQAMHRRYHDHDVKCAVGYESKGLSVLVSGGMDASPVILSISNWKSDYHRALSHLPQTPQMSTSNNRLLLAWWRRELSIYLIPERSADGDISKGPDDYVLLATLQLKGDEHIQSAQISRDGNFVVASTVQGVRLFQLRKTTSSGSLALRSRPVTLPSAFQAYGARHVGFSSDLKWLYAVRFDNIILLAKMTTSSDPRAAPIFHPKTARLEPAGDEEDGGPLRDYTDAVSVVKFSPDSRVLAVGTLSGYITSWTLEGHEDPNFVTSNPSSRASSGSESDSDSDSSSDSDTEDDAPLIHAQRWTRTTRLPRLDSSILLLLFRTQPPTSKQSRTQTHTNHLTPPSSNIALHPTRHNPYPVAHEHPSPPPLLVLTATHSLHELDLPTGTFTPWSRRNPPHLLRWSFRRIKDCAMGGFMHGQRLWLYGAGWMYMMDLTHDFPLPSAAPSSGSADGENEAEQSRNAGAGKKRKRSQKDINREKEKERQARGIGAGDKIHNNRDRGGAAMPAAALKYKGSGAGKMELVDLEERVPHGREDEDGFGEGGSDELVRLRRAEGETDGKEAGGRDGLGQWFTFRYRAIFGVGVLSGDGDDGDDGDGDGNGDVTMQDADADVNTATNRKDEIDKDRLEVVIVERPMYEVAQAPRFDGGQDWDA